MSELVPVRPKPPVRTITDVSWWRRFIVWKLLGRCSNAFYPWDHRGTGLQCKKAKGHKGAHQSLGGRTW